MSTSADRYLSRIVSTFLFDYAFSSFILIDEIKDVEYDEDNLYFNAHCSKNDFKLKLKVDISNPVKDKYSVLNRVNIDVYLYDKKKEFCIYTIRYNINGTSTNSPYILNYSTPHYDKLKDVCNQIIGCVLKYNNMDKLMTDDEYIAFNTCHSILWSFMSQNCSK